ncbi:MAG: hypothetical protein M1834_007438 [Cirrosporium novae-zelandiae]|nr:MAG: hypothetical protein M1834_007438 [Cirrosporium novae-zelandiae]
MTESTPLDVSRGSTIYGTVISLTLLALFQMVFRLHTRIFVTRAVGWDDYLAALAMVIGVVSSIFNVVAVNYGFGRHVEYLAVDELIGALKYTFFAEPSNVLAVFFLKLSIAISLLRLNLGRRYRWTVYTAVLINFLATLTALIAQLGRCHPFVSTWDVRVTGNCWPATVNEGTGYAQSVANIVTDLVFTTSPLVYIAKAKLRKWHQWALRVIFLFGLFATVCSVVKTTELGALLVTTDYTYASVNLVCWSVAELNVGLYTASTPPLKPRFDTLISRVFIVKSLSSPTTRGRTGAYGRSRYASNRSGYRMHADENDIDLMYYRPRDGVKVEGGSRDVGHGRDGSSEDMILRDADAGAGDDGIKVVKTVDVDVREGDEDDTDKSTLKGVP